MHNTTKHITPLGNYDVPSGWPMKPYKRPYGGTPGAPVMYEKPSDPEDEGAGYGYSNAEGIEEKDVFFYHSDHLGSTSYITDKDGNATQFVSYKPYGEVLVDEHAASFESPWKFNGKELDSETGLYYYGARYYEPVLALWYGVDALTEKYPNMGGYVYCAGNPVKLVDVDGNDWYEAEDGTMQYTNKHYKSQKDFSENSGLKGTWKGYTTEKDGVYYGLLSKDCVMKVDKNNINYIASKAIDDAIIKYTESNTRVDFSKVINHFYQSTDGNDGFANAVKRKNAVLKFFELGVVYVENNKNKNLSFQGLRGFIPDEKADEKRGLKYEVNQGRRNSGPGTISGYIFHLGNEYKQNTLIVTIPLLSNAKIIDNNYSNLFK